MCTLTFFPKSDTDFILTSNRDEAPERKTLFPRIYIENEVRLLYPKDAVAGGSWIGISERKRTVSLMNGGFVAHVRKPEYRKSRGVVLKDFLMAPNLKTLIGAYDFQGIEPFTAVSVDWSSSLELYTIVWDAEKLHLIEEDIAPRIWSSSPLYPTSLKSKRELWFDAFLKGNKNPEASDLLYFHHTAGEGDVSSNLIMDRKFVKTKSITQVAKSGNEIAMEYEDLDLNKREVTRFE